MWILLLEAGLAVGLLLFIVWWTLGPTQRREREAARRALEDAMRAEAGRPSAASQASGPTSASGASAPSDDPARPGLAPGSNGSTDRARR